MTNRQKKPKCCRIFRSLHILLLTATLFWIPVALTEDNERDVYVDQTVSDPETHSETVIDSIEDTQAPNEALEQPQTLEVDRQTDEQAPASIVKDAPTAESTATETSGSTDTDHESPIEPSPTETLSSAEEADDPATIETSGTSQSVHTNQLEGIVLEPPLEIQDGSIPEKSLFTTVNEPVKESESKESQEQVPDSSEKLDDKIGQDHSTDSEPKPEGKGEPTATDSTADQKDDDGSTPDSKPGPVDVDAEKKQGEKTDEEILTFDEWVRAEEEKEKHQAKSENVAVSITKQRKKKNYALQECGAKILTSNPEATNVKSVLNPNRDDYMINPCKVKKWFVIELCEPIQAVNVEMASLELFSSQPKSFKVFLSDRYPTKDWKLAIQSEMTEERALQSFDVEGAEGIFAKFVRVELLDHYSNEHFCPLTLFRLFGIAYDISDGEVDHDEPDSDDEEVPPEDEDSGDSRNLFSSAKDTVLKIVKKVLNVDDQSDEVQKLNETTDNYNQNGSVQAEQPLNTSRQPSLPCPPDISIPGSGKPEASSGGDQQQHAGPVLPEIRDDETLVIKIEDHEQIETGDQSFLSGTNKKLWNEKIEHCFSCANDTQKASFSHSFPVMQLCVYVKLLLDKYKGQTCSTPVLTVKTEEEQKDETKFESSQSFSSQTGSKNSESESDTKIIEVVEQSEVQSSITISDTKSEFATDTKNEVLPEPSVTEQIDHSTIVSDEIMATVVSETVTEVVKDVLPEHTQLVSESSEAGFQSSETIIPTQTVLMPQSNGHDSVTDSASESTVMKIPDDRIDPSPSFIVDSDGTILTSMSSEPTPKLQETESQPIDISDSVTVSVEAGMLKDKAFPETGSIVVDKPITTESQPVEPTVSVAVEPASPDKQEPIQDNQEQEPVNGKAQQIPEDNVQGVDQATVSVEEKAESKGTEEGTKQKPLDLVKVPLVPLTKRESALMRLNNRIKVLEQNVSLSSRFLEELSKRYKKQSEDMMKLLNKTVARLNNATLEAEIKDKLHDDAITTMESRVENLTSIVTELTVRLDQLNKQVTDRQMIWTSIEIIVLMIIVIVVFRRSKTPTITPEIKHVTQTTTLPAQSTKPPFRRNSLSGPATPLKSKSDLDPGPSLQRFSSDTALVHAEYPVIEPGETPFFTPKPKDVQKKKKKKKHKNLESRFLAGLQGNDLDLGQENRLNNTPLPGSSINVAGVLFKGENNEKIETSLKKTMNKEMRDKNLVDSARTQRSNSSASCSSSGTSIGSSEIKVCDKSPGLFQGAISKAPSKFSGLSLDSGKTGVSSKKPHISPLLPRSDKNFMKGHKRQKSLPLTPSKLPLAENIGRVENNVSDETFVKERCQSMQKGPKSKGSVVRKSLSMTNPSRGSKHADNVNTSENKFHGSSKMGKGTTQQRGGNVCNGVNDLSAQNGCPQFDEVINYSDSKFDDCQTGQKKIYKYSNGGVGIKGSKSCYDIDPGGATNFGQPNGYDTSGQQYTNGHSFNSLGTYYDRNKMNGHSIKDVLADNRLDFDQKDNADIPARSGWKKVIWWS